jgi:hypothetical protein
VEVSTFNCGAATELSPARADVETSVVAIMAAALRARSLVRIVMANTFSFFDEIHIGTFKIEYH